MASEIAELESVVFDPPSEAEAKAAEEALQAWNEGEQDSEECRSD